MKGNPWIDPSDHGALVQQLGDPIRAKRAWRHLIAAGSRALSAVRVGLSDTNSDVRMHCVRALDHLVDEDAWPQLVEMLGDNDPRVRSHALHAIACDRCKEDSCRPEKRDLLPPALATLRDDPSYHVRAMAVEVVAQFVHDDAQAAGALSAARDEDPHPMVRKKAGWNAPGGPLFRKTAPRRRKS